MLQRTQSNLILHGVLFLLVGVLCIVVPNTAYHTAIWILGLAFILFGVLSILLQRRDGSRNGGMMPLITAVLMAVVGIVIIVWPHILSILMGVVVLVEGVDFVLQALKMRRVGAKVRLVLLVIGLVAVLLGLWIVLSPRMGEALISIVMGLSCCLIAADCFIALAGIRLLTR